MKVSRPFAGDAGNVRIVLTAAEAGELVHSLTRALRNDGRPGPNIAWVGSTRDGVSDALQFVIEKKKEDTKPDTMETELVAEGHEKAYHAAKAKIADLASKRYRTEEIVVQVLHGKTHHLIRDAEVGDTDDEIEVRIGNAHDDQWYFFTIDRAVDVSLQGVDEA